MRNMQGTPVNFMTGRMTAEIVSGNNRAGLRIYAYGELVKEEKTRQTWQALAVGLSGAARSYQAANAGFVHTTGSYNASVYGAGSGYTGSVHGAYSATSYDSSRAFAAQEYASARTAADFAAIQAQGEHNLARLQQTIIKDHTLMPGEWFGGLVVLDTPKKSESGLAEYLITIDLGGEAHTFRVRQTPAT
jgi:hypothetical protein